jgi:hypothetical protein
MHFTLHLFLNLVEYCGVQCASQQIEVIKLVTILQNNKPHTKKKKKERLPLNMLSKIKCHFPQPPCFMFTLKRKRNVARLWIKVPNIISYISFIHPFIHTYRHIHICIFIYSPCFFSPRMVSRSGNMISCTLESLLKLYSTRRACPRP